MTAKSTESKRKRAKQTKSPFPKLALLCDCLSHLTLSLRTDRGPYTDHKYFKPLLDEAAALFTIARLLADAGFDSEEHHEYARGEQVEHHVAIIATLLHLATGRHLDSRKPAFGYSTFSKPSLADFVSCPFFDDS